MNVSIAPASTDHGTALEKDKKKKLQQQVRRKDTNGKIIESFVTKADKMLKYYPGLFSKDLLVTEFACGQNGKKKHLFKNKYFTMHHVPSPHGS